MNSHVEHPPGWLCKRTPVTGMSPILSARKKSSSLFLGLLCGGFLGRRLLSIFNIVSCECTVSSHLPISHLFWSSLRRGCLGSWLVFGLLHRLLDLLGRRFGRSRLLRCSLLRRSVLGRCCLLSGRRQHRPRTAGKTSGLLGVLCGLLGGGARGACVHEPFKATANLPMHPIKRHAQGKLHASPLAARPLARRSPPKPPKQVRSRHRRCEEAPSPQAGHRRASRDPPVSEVNGAPSPQVALPAPCP